MAEATENFSGSNNHQLEEMRERSLHRVGLPVGGTQSQEAILPINSDGGIMKRTEVIFVTELERCGEALRSWRL
jgi:hypothetical protein